MSAFCDTLLGDEFASGEAWVYDAKPENEWKLEGIGST